MRQIGTLLVSVCALVVPSFSSPAIAGPGEPAARATRQAIPADVQALADRATRNTRTSPDGLIGEGPQYKVRFADGAFTYFPTQNGQLGTGWSYRFVRATVGGHIVVDAAAAPVPTASGEGTTVVEFSRGPISERYSLRDDGVEQVFVIHQRLGDGALVLDGVVEDWRAPSGHAPSGVTFDRPGATAVRYGAVTVVDADHRAISAPVTIEGTRLRITVDGAWLATAKYPVAVDPIITRAMVLQGNEETSARRPSIAFDSRRNRYFAVFDRAEGLPATPRNVIGLVINAAGRQRQTEVNIGVAVAFDEFEPAVDYQPVSDEYLVAYTAQYDPDTDIVAKRVSAGTLALITGGGGTLIDEIGTSGRRAFVRATSGSGANRWLVGWQDDRDADFDTVWTLYGRLVSSTSALSAALFLSGTEREEDINGDAAFNPRTGQFLVVFESKDGGDADRIIRGVSVNATTAALTPMAAAMTSSGIANAPSVIYNLPLDQFWVAWTNDAPAFAITVLTGAAAPLSGVLELDGSVTDADITRGTAGEVVAMVSLTLASDPPGDTDTDIAGVNFQYYAPSGSFVIESGAGNAPTHDDRIPRTVYNPYYGSYATVRDHWSEPAVEHDVEGTLVGGSYYPIRSAGGRFDADALTDRTVVRINPTSEQMTWFVNRSTGGAPLAFNWGTAGDVPVAGNYAGDARTDFAVWRPGSGTWYISPSDGTPSYNVNWGGGQYGDIPVPADYNGDSRAEIAVFRPGANATWYLTGSAGGGLVSSTVWGTWGDVPVPGDYNGDGVDDLAVWRPSNGVWYIRYSGGGTAVIPWGQPADQPVVGDFDGDGTDDLAVFRTMNGAGAWYVRQSSGGTTTTAWGQIGDLAIPGDFNGDGRTDLTVWRPGTSAAFFSKYYGAAGGLTLAWGTSFDLPIAK